MTRGEKYILIVLSCRERSFREPEGSLGVTRESFAANPSHEKGYAANLVFMGIEKLFRFFFSSHYLLNKSPLFYLHTKRIIDENKTN